MRLYRRRYRLVYFLRSKANSLYGSIRPAPQLPEITEQLSPLVAALKRSDYSEFHNWHYLDRGDTGIV